MPQPLGMLFRVNFESAVTSRIKTFHAMIVFISLPNMHLFKKKWFTIPLCYRLEQPMNSHHDPYTFSISRPQSLSEETVLE